MNLTENQKEMIELLRQLEVDMSNLYRLFSNKFPRHKDLWITLSQQEIDHANRIKALHSLIQENKAIFDERLIKLGVVKRLLAIIKDTHAKTEANQLSILNALSLSRDLEQSIIEKEVYKSFISVSPHARTLINSFKDETFIHQYKLNKAWEEEKGL